MDNTYTGYAIMLIMMKWKMVAAVNNGKDHNISTDKETMFVPYQDSTNANLAFYKAEKKGFEPDFELEDWPEEDLEFLLYEMSTESSVLR